MRYSASRSLPSALLLAVAVAWSAPAGASAQSLTEFCPEGDAEIEAAVVGIVSDAESGMQLPGAEVAASWVADGMRQRATAQTDIEGVYIICGLPQALDMQVRASIGGHRGAAVAFTTDVVLQQHDLQVSLAAEAETEDVELDEDARSGRAFSASVIEATDLANLPEMSVYELLRRHHRLRFERVSGGELIVFAGRGVDGTPSLSGTTRYSGIQLFVDDRLQADAVNYLRSMSIDEVRQIDILSRTEASARYGGDGWIGAIAIRTR